MALFIGIDSGTQSTKAVVVDLEARRVVAEARAPHRMIAGLPLGAMEQEPRQWTSALDTVLREVGARIDRTRVRAIGVSGQQHGFVPPVLTPPGRSSVRPSSGATPPPCPECSQLTELASAARRCRPAPDEDARVPFLPGYTAGKILWLKRHEPKNYRRLRHVLLPHDYLNFYLTGNYFMEYGDASGTALMDVRKRAWSAQAIAAVDRNLADWLPPLSPSEALAGALQPWLAKKYGFPADVAVSAGGGDNMMGAIGTGNVVPGVVTASFGTSGTIYALARKPVVDPRGEIAAFCSSTDGWLPLLCTMNVTNVTEQMRALFDTNHAGLDLAVESAPPGAGGLVLLPYLAGERTPNLPDSSAVFFGLNRRTMSHSHLARATMEGVTLGMNYGLRRLAELGVRAKEIRASRAAAREVSGLAADHDGHLQRSPSSAW